jgi:two-component system, LytTR family, response regulator
MKAIIIDDEQKGRNLLKELLARYCPDVKVLALAKNALEGIEQIKLLSPDVIFLDINMPEIDGFGMLERLGMVNFDLIFVTAYHQHAIRAYKFMAFDYLLKPIDPEELIATIERLKAKKNGLSLQDRLQLLMKQMEQPHKSPTRLTIHSTDGITVLNISEIVCLEADGPYTIFHLNAQPKIISSRHLKEYDEMLSPNGFFRCHHSFLVNMNHIKRYVRTDNYVILSNGFQAEVSKRRKDEFLLKLENG